MSRLTLLIVFLGWLLPVTAGTSVAEPNLSAQSHYERPTSRDGPYKQRVIVFVHGMFGGADDTWTNSQTHAYWPTLLLNDPRFNDSDVYVASYASPHFGNTMNITEIAKSLESRLVNDEVFKHREVVFVCHSLGGLVVQQLLLLNQEDANQVPFIYFFSTPESGAQIARLGSLFSSDPLLTDTFSGDENEYLQILEESWKAAHFHIHRLCAYEKKPYKGVLVVDRLSGTRNCETTLPINEDHLGIVKPDGTDHPSYIALRNAVKRYPIKPASPTPKQGPTSRPSVGHRSTWTLFILPYEPTRVTRCLP
jgi:pimeloyl-ACP methyl ester carboxylesterase